MSSVKVNIPLRTLVCAIKKNGLKQLFFYLSNLDTIRFIEYTKVFEFLRDISQPKAILDLGCGYSVLPELIQSQLSNEYICLDINQAACKYQANAIKNVSPVRANMCYLPFKSSSIPVVLAISSIEHVPDDFLVFQEISRVLAKDGIAIMSVDFSANDVKMKKIVHSRLLMHILYKFKRFWRIVLGQHLDYFIGQTSVDSIIKHYNEREISKCLTPNGLRLTDSYLYNKSILQKFHRIFPFGWFVLKDLILGLLFWKVEDIFLKEIKDSAIIIMKVRKAAA